MSSKRTNIGVGHRVAYVTSEKTDMTYATPIYTVFSALNH